MAQICRLPRFLGECHILFFYMKVTTSRSLCDNLPCLRVTHGYKSHAENHHPLFKPPSFTACRTNMSLDAALFEPSSFPHYYGIGSWFSRLLPILSMPRIFETSVVKMLIMSFFMDLVPRICSWLWGRFNYCLYNFFIALNS